MKIEQIYTGCLAEAAYYIESAGEAAIIDPLRETMPYVQKAERNEAKIKYIFETHFHADFVSGHVDLARKTGAQIVYGPKAEASFDFIQAKDGQSFTLGNVEIIALHTPGHTPESTTYLIRDEEGLDHAIFTGDTLFIGDVGRPDLAVKSDLTQEDLAGMLYDSLRNKIMPLDDNIVVYPAHGAGSACGKNMSKETFDTLGNQKKVNYALRDMTKDQFIKEVLDGLAPPPQYFPKNALMNKMGYTSFDHVMEQGVNPMDVKTFETVAEAENALILDTRAPEDFVKGFIPGSIFIGIDGNFAPWVGTMITDLSQPILFISDEGREEEVVMRLSRVGYDHTLGFLEGGIKAWKEAGKVLDSIESMSAEEFAAQYADGEINVLDVRRPGEYDGGHLEKAQNLPLDYLNEHMAEIKPENTYYVHCAGGYRSVITASVLKSRNFKHLVNVEGGYGKITQTSLPKESFVMNVQNA